MPFNTASYALLTMMVAQVVGMAPGEFIHTFGDLHAYSNHIEGLKEWMTRPTHKLPRMRINPQVKNIDDFKLEDFALEGYTSGEKINFSVAY